MNRKILKENAMMKIYIISFIEILETELDKIKKGCNDYTLRNIYETELKYFNDVLNGLEKD